MPILSFLDLPDPPQLEHHKHSKLHSSIRKPLMENLFAYATRTALVIIILSVVRVRVVADGGRDQCRPFSCGNLHNVSSPFRRSGDPPECGEQAYELLCSKNKAIIRIKTATYFVTGINRTGSSFWVLDATLDMHCPLPQSYLLPDGLSWTLGSNYHVELSAYPNEYWACFVNCSQAVRNNSPYNYKPVTCLSTNSSFVYVSMSDRCSVFVLEPSCGYLAAAPVGRPIIFDSLHQQLENASEADIIELVNKGFSLRFPFDEYFGSLNASWIFNTCLKNSTSYFHEQLSGARIRNWTRAFFWSEVTFVKCVNYYDHPATAIFWVIVVIAPVIGIIKLLIVCRLLVRALVAFAFLAHKYWKTRITIDAVEKFLQMQHMLGPIRYAYTDITAITSHFRDKLGQGGYGSVYKGVFQPGDVHVAVKMLGNSNCNGDEFISEVSTIGRIHHINIVRLLGFCAEETRRALIYEYMPHGSLDKYIFSHERGFSWDKLTDIALGIARGLNYLHQGCDMQILHFDIKPHNILLDSNFVPKVADFGLAKLYPRDKSFIPASALRGTIGYIAPELVSRSFGVISSKSDVYSFGMLLLEMAGGRRNADQDAGSSSQAYYPSWVYDRLMEQEGGEISAAADMHELEKKLCIIGLRCIQMKPHDRPIMSEVIEMLEGGPDGLRMPSRPFFCDDKHISAEDSDHCSSELTAISEEDE